MLRDKRELEVPICGGKRVLLLVVGNMEDEGLNIWMDWILYSIFFPRASYFLVVLPEDKQDNQKHCCHNVYAPLWAQMGLMKRA